MDPKEEETLHTKLPDRFRRSLFPLAAVAGALASFVAAGFRTRPAPKEVPRPAEPSLPPAPPDQAAKPAAPPAALERKYVQTAVLGGAASAHPFRRSLTGIAVDAADRIYALGDDEVRVFDSQGNRVRGWKTLEKAGCIAFGRDDRVYIGALGRVEIYDSAGSPAGGFAAGETDRPAAVTAIKIVAKEILVADAAARLIRRYDLSGKQLGVVGMLNKTRGFMLPNGWLDFDVDSEGVIRATDTGRHQVTAWSLDGTPRGTFGKFGMTSPADFVGCCNPVNLALTPDGKVVTGEKMVARVKVYEPDGRLLGVIGPENFDLNCEHIHLAVDSRGRILAADPVRREIKIFSLEETKRP